MRKEFEVHMLNELGKNDAREIAIAFELLLDTLESIAPVDCREMSIVRTKLEEACFFAKKAMANIPENQQSPST